MKKRRVIVPYLIIFYIIIYISTITYWDSQYGDKNLAEVFFVLLLIVLTSTTIARFLRKGKVGLTIFFLFCYFIYCALSFLSTSTSSFNSLYPYLVLPCFIFVTYFLGKNVDVKEIIFFMTICGSIISVLCIHEYVSHSFISGKYANPYIALRPEVYADSPLSLGAQLGVSVILCLALYKEERKKGYLFLLTIIFIALLFTLSRGPLVGCVFGIFFFFVIDMNRQKQFRKKYLFFICGLFSLFIFFFFLGLGVIEVDASHVVLSRILSIFNWTSEGSNLGRLYKWKKYWSEFLKAPIWGRGIGFVKNSHYGVTESGFIQRLVETGVIGTIIYYVILLRIVICGLRRVKDFCDNSYIILGVISAVICIMVYDFAYQIFESTIGGSLLWMMLGILLGEFEAKREIAL